VALIGKGEFLLFCTGTNKLSFGIIWSVEKKGEFKQCIITLKKVKPCII